MLTALVHSDITNGMGNTVDDTNGSWDFDTAYARDIERCHAELTPRFRAAYERTMGAVEMFCADKRQAIPVVKDETPLTILRNAGLL